MTLAAVFVVATGCDSTEVSRPPSPPSPVDDDLSPDVGPDSPSPPAAPADDVDGDEILLSLTIHRPNTMFGFSTECFTFYADNTIELRHRGLPEVSDVGVYYEDGTIEWESGRNSTWEGDGETFIVDGVQGAVVGSCLVPTGT